MLTRGVRIDGKEGSAVKLDKKSIENHCAYTDLRTIRRSDNILLISKYSSRDNSSVPVPEFLFMSDK